MKKKKKKDYIYRFKLKSCVNEKFNATNRVKSVLEEMGKNAGFTQCHKKNPYPKIVRTLDCFIKKSFGRKLFA